jgi:hypothetical protein
MDLQINAHIHTGTVGEIEVRSCGSGMGRGLYSTADLAKGAELLSLPDSLILTTTSALKSDIGRELASKCRVVRACEDSDAFRVEAGDTSDGEEAEGGGSAGSRRADDKLELTERSVLYTYLLETKHAKPSTTASRKCFQGLVECLPSTFSTPFSWTREDLARLPQPMDELDHERVDLLSELGKIGEHLRAQFNVVRSALEDGDSARLLERLTMREWLWAHQVYLAPIALGTSRIHDGSVEPQATVLCANTGMAFCSGMCF